MNVLGEELWRIAQNYVLRQKYSLDFTAVTSVLESALQRRRNDNQRADGRAIRLALLTERESLSIISKFSSVNHREKVKLL